MLRSFRPLLLVAVFSTLGPVATTGCNRWRPAQSYVVEGSATAKDAADAISRVLTEKHYKIKSREELAFVVVARNFETSEAQRSYIKIVIAKDGHKVVLTASGYLARADGTIHRKLERELEDLELSIKQRLPKKRASAPAPTTETRTEASGLPKAWSERAYEPSTWGSDEFTCIPAQVAPEDQAALRLRLSDGTEANIAISIAYAAELCRSPKQCSLPNGCPALGLGDEKQVQALAERLARKEITTEATLIVRGDAIATIDLARHGSIAKALAGAQK